MWDNILAFKLRGIYWRVHWYYLKTALPSKLNFALPHVILNDLLAEWNKYISSLLNNDSGQSPSDLPASAAFELPIQINPLKRTPRWQWSIGQICPLVLYGGQHNPKTTQPMDHQFYCFSSKEETSLSWPNIDMIEEYLFCQLQPKCTTRSCLQE